MEPVRCRDGELTVGGDPVQLRGVGIGNWLLPEGYMWRFTAGATSPRRIERLIRDLIGEEDAAAFWRTFRATFFTRDDVAAIAALGFDHIRLPLNSRLFITHDGEDVAEGHDLVDRCLEWCREHGLRVLLDLHGAPGGQTGANIDDSVADQPELFTDGRARELCIELWRRLARRHRDHPALLGYDLLNEPLPEAHRELWPQLVPLYRDLTAAIRAEDPHHLLMYEGAHWATEFSMFTEPLDDNACLQFHHYWSPVEAERFEGVRRRAASLGMATYMGESGENSPQWLHSMFHSCEDLGISWNFWCWKKLGTTTSPLSAPVPEGWAELTARAEGRGEGPDQDRATTLLAEFLHNIRVEHCETQTPVIQALPIRGALP
ncbi:glycoside hydrolase family 5 protein [Arachnia propionica]|uniref:Endoglucanase n=1 Tax=Arachnia propionica TaxID=1750 RepID=A0A3P1WUC9_9ACTN|nr:cellulase family glycosylhydrolase [Arachnia propionica]RRD50214.1 endoglucanase [Arachnia propionica]